MSERVVTSAGADHQAADLLSQLIESIHVVKADESGAITATFEGDLVLFARLALWNSGNEDAEDDDPTEDDGRLLDFAEAA